MTMKATQVSSQTKGKNGNEAASCFAESASRIEGVRLITRASVPSSSSSSGEVIESEAISEDSISIKTNLFSGRDDVTFSRVSQWRRAADRRGCGVVGEGGRVTVMAQYLLQLSTPLMLPILCSGVNGKSNDQPTHPGH
ncbi:hypothetical protein E2C01_030787 [Portunus trituberculatus]|uniref:Uncharacterized protein n=1 Tax=Portunus trituberculatus TaxID=210409 RepID=A0A5B7EWR9_PORTR|nr:hypothetical protein [Portunus trituberculatus]